MIWVRVPPAQEVAARVADVGQRRSCCRCAASPRRWCPCPPARRRLHRLVQALVGRAQAVRQQLERVVAAVALAVEVRPSRPRPIELATSPRGVAAHAVGDARAGAVRRSRSPGWALERPAPRWSGRRSAGRCPSALLPQLEDGLADAQGGPGLDQDRVGEAVVAQVGAVGGAEVLDVPALGPLEDAGVAAGGEVVVQDERALGVAAEQDTGGLQRQRSCRPGALGDGQGGGDPLGGAARQLGRGSGRLWRRGGPGVRAGRRSGRPSSRCG